MKVFMILFMLLCIAVLVNSTLDVYNNFAYDKAVVRDSPYGSTPLLTNPGDFKSADGQMKNGDYVYVVDWLSAYENKIPFAKVKSKLKEGFINNRLLVETNLNIKPVISVLLLVSLMIYFTRKIFKKFVF
jgi:hypothetical protein